MAPKAGLPLTLLAAAGMVVAPASVFASGPDTQTPTHEITAEAPVAYPTIHPDLLKTEAENDPAAQREIIDYAAGPLPVSNQRLEAMGMDETAAKIISENRNEGHVLGAADAQPGGQTAAEWWKDVEPGLIEARKTSIRSGLIGAAAIGLIIGLVTSGPALASAGPGRRY
ncbi:MAG: hypothetical protein KI792_14415 [Alphaproteobacteria bacterium]|nr:hypothetical protein [Alphaproteobacteria bacterium SS10]